jgi:Flp pilus assembly protein TadG
MRRILLLVRDTSGVNMIEAAIVTPLMILLTFGILDFASMFYVQLALENGVSQATRFAVTGNVMDDPDHPGSQMSHEASIKAAMRQATPTLTIPDDAFAFQHLSGTSWVGGPGGPSDIQRVRVTYTWTLLTPLVKTFFTDGKVVLVADSTMKNEGRFN